MISCGSLVAAQHDGVGHARHRRMGVALAPAVAGRLHAHQAGVLAVLHQADQAAVLDQHVALGRRALVVDGERAAAVGSVPSSTTVTPGEAIMSPIILVNTEVFLRWKSPSSPWPTASCHSTPDQPGPSTTGISPAGAAHRLQVDQRLADRLVGLALPVFRLEDVAVGARAGRCRCCRLPCGCRRRRPR